MDKNKSNEWILKWIVATKGGKRMYFYIDDQVAFGGSKKSDQINPLLNGFYGNSIFSFEAIRKVFGLKRREGREKSHEWFWETAKLPKEIAAKIKDFGSHFIKLMVKGYISCEQLAFVLRVAPEEWKLRVWTPLTLHCPPKEFSKILGGILEGCFFKRIDRSLSYKLNDEWKNTLSSKILELRTEELRERYGFLTDKLKIHDRYLEFILDWDIAVLEKTVKPKFENLVKRFEGIIKKGWPADPKFVYNRRRCNLWDVVMVEKIHDDTHEQHKKAKLIREIFALSKKIWL